MLAALAKLALLAQHMTIQDTGDVDRTRSPIAWSLMVGRWRRAWSIAGHWPPVLAELRWSQKATAADRCLYQRAFRWLHLSIAPWCFRP